MDTRRIATSNKYRILGVIAETNLGPEPPSQAEIGEVLGLHRNTISRHVQELIAEGHLVRHRGHRTLVLA